MSNKLASAIMASLVTTCLAVTVLPAQAASAQGKWVKCYGVVKAKKNDCGTPKHSCAGLATTDGDSSEWILLPPGVCNNIAGGNENTPGGGLAEECKNSASK